MTPSSPAHHYLVISDLHLSDVEDHLDGWKRHKSSAWVYDDELDDMVRSFEARLEPGDTFTLILNGDVFDFDLVTAIPDAPTFTVRPIEHEYGLDATAEKSAWKLGRILDDHPRFVALLARVLAAGHRLVVVIGNHDRELWFAEVEAVLRGRIDQAIAALEPRPANVRGELLVEPWFYSVPGEVFVEHGHQYDYYTSFRYNLEPVVERHGEVHIALSSGNLSNRFLLSNIGFFNPHATDYILTAYGYLRHWVRHYAFSGRALFTPWLIGSVRALIALLGNRARLEANPPRDYERHIAAAAARYGLDLETTRALYALRKEPITNRIYKMVREFWLDRLALATAMIAISLTLFASGVPLAVKLIVPLLVFPLVWFVYQWIAGNENVLTTEYRAQTFAHHIARMIPVRAVVFGHTHVPGLTPLTREASFANSGTWAPIWDKRGHAPAPGLRNYVHVRITELGRARPGPVGPEPPGAQHDERGAGFLEGCQITVGSWLPGRDVG